MPPRRFGFAKSFRQSFDCRLRMLSALDAQRLRVGRVLAKLAGAPASRPRVRGASGLADHAVDLIDQTPELLDEAVALEDLPS
jgi:hypothetical protein